jgi:transposase-like protein
VGCANGIQTVPWATCSGRKLRTSNVIERDLVEVRRRTRASICFRNVASVDRIIYAIFNGYNERREWQNPTLRPSTQAA